MSLVLVLNNPTASDFLVQDGFLQIAGSSVPLPRPSLVKNILETSQVFEASVKTLTFTAVNNTEYVVTISQQLLNGRIEQRTVSYTSDSTASLAEIAAGLVASINALQLNGFLVTATGASSPVTVTSQAPQAFFDIVGSANVTVAAAQPTIAPNGTPALAIVDSLASATTASDRIDGTTTVTIETDGDHGLRPGDVVDLTLGTGGVDTAFIDLRPGANQALTKTVTNVIIASVPTSNTFTLQQIQAGGGTYTGNNNDETLTIRMKNVVRVVTNAAHNLSVGQLIGVTGIATFTVNGGSSVTGKVISTPAATVFNLLGAGNDSAANANTGTIVISELAQSLAGGGAAILALISSGVDTLVTGSALPVAANTYTKFSVTGFPTTGVFLGSPVEDVIPFTVYLSESGSSYPDAMKRVAEILADFAPGTTLADPEALAV
jgi:hypothetical protein